MRVFRTDIIWCADFSTDEHPVILGSIWAWNDPELMHFFAKNISNNICLPSLIWHNMLRGHYELPA